MFTLRQLVLTETTENHHLKNKKNRNTLHPVIVLYTNIFVSIRFSIVNNHMKSFVVLTFVLLSLFTFSQCPAGTIGVTGTGCGCISGCDLTSLGGPNCSPAVTGNCNAGNVPFLTTITVPDGCTYTVTAVMQNRSVACNASGADAGDGLKVDIPGGPKPLQTGTGNASISDSYTLVGPGTIEISGTANRADEIVTYSTTFSGATCVNCMSVLPVGLTLFDVLEEFNKVACVWQTETEQNNHYFTIEKSLDGIHFEHLGNLFGHKNSESVKHYKLYDSSPTYNQISYYRLSQTDLDGKRRILDTKSIFLEKEEQLEIYPNPSKGLVHISGNEKVLKSVELFDNTGRKIQYESSSYENKIEIMGLPNGHYNLKYYNGKLFQQKQFIVIQ